MVKDDIQRGPLAFTDVHMHAHTPVYTCAHSHMNSYIPSTMHTCENTHVSTLGDLQLSRTYVALGLILSSDL